MAKIGPRSTLLIPSKSVKLQNRAKQQIYFLHVLCKKLSVGRTRVLKGLKEFLLRFRRKWMFLMTNGIFEDVIISFLVDN